MAKLSSFRRWLRAGALALSCLAFADLGRAVALTPYGNVAGIAFPLQGAVSLSIASNSGTASGEVRIMKEGETPPFEYGDWRISVVGRLGTSFSGTFYYNTPLAITEGFYTAVLLMNYGGTYTISAGVDFQVNAGGSGSVLPFTSVPAVQISSGPMAFKNPYTREQIIQVRDDVTGEVLQEFRLAPGEEWLGTLKKADDGHGIKVFVNSPQGQAAMVQNVDGSWGAYTISAGSTFHEVIDSAIPFEDMTVSRSEWEAVTRVDMAHPVGNLTPSGTTPATASGSAKIVDGTAKTVQFSEGAGSGDATDKSVREGLSAVVKSVGDLHNTVKSFNDLHDAAKAGNPASGAAASATTTAQNAFSSEFGTRAPGLPGLGSSTESNTTPTAPAMFQIALPHVGPAGSNMVVDLNPLGDELIAGLCRFIKGAVAWAVLFYYFWWLWKELKQFSIMMPAIRQAEGNPVFGGTGGQATALLNATVITAIIFAVPATFWALADSNIGFSVLAGSPLDHTDAPEGTKFLARTLLPMGTITAVIASMLIVRKGAVLMYQLVAAGIRFCVS